MSTDAHALPRPHSLPPVVAAMMRPEFYPQRPAEVELRQTHISYVLLAGEFVYKVKKPVRFPFVDYSTLQARRHFCAEEVRLNRRLSPDVYLGVAPIVSRPSGLELGRIDAARNPLPEPEVAEYAVKMKRLPQERMLARMVERGRVCPEAIDAIARKLAAFHAVASREQGECYGMPAAVWKMLAGNLAEIEQFIGYTMSARELTAVDDFNRTFVSANWALLRERARHGRVREGHGDLRCEHICLVDGLKIFDCLEFSARLRYGDVACELAFLAMDLDRLGAPALARRLVATYAEAAGDDAVAHLMPLYQCYRACVRGKVESLKSLEGDVAEVEREQAREHAWRYFHLAYRYARRCAPALVIVCGPAASGKSTLARALGQRTDFAVLSSDSVRKRLAGLPPDAPAAAPYGEGIYSAEHTRQAYAALLGQAYELIAAGRGVIVDATFKDRAHRRMFLAMAEQARMRALFVECRASEREVLDRLARREQQAGQVSDATRAIYLRQREEFETLDEISDRCRLVVDTTQELARTVKEVEDLLERG